MIRPRGKKPTILCDEVACTNPSLPGGCHVFRGSITSKGYGQITYKGKSLLVHRFIWEREVGPIPKGMQIDHQCRVRACCNPDHLRIVTQKINLTENVRGSCWQLLKERTHCPRGHPYDAHNTGLQRKPNRSNPSRYCKTCNRIKARLNREKRRKT